METHIKTIAERIRRVNREYNTSDKYLNYFQDENDFYSKIGNRLNEFASVSQWLVHFLIGTPPLVDGKPAPSKDADEDEKLADYEDKNTESQAPLLNFADKDFSLKQLENLPLDVESEFDFNYLLFYSFLAYIKPANYFIHEHELVPYSKKESLKENITRVLANLVQLLIFVRSYEGEESSDLRVVATSLIYHYNELFTINAIQDETDEPMHEVQNFLIIYPQQAAQLMYFLIAYDTPPENESFAEFKESLDLVLSVFENTPKYQDYQNYLLLEKPLLKSTCENCSTIEEYQNKIRQFFLIKDLKSSLLDLAFTLSNKVMFQIGKIQDWKSSSYLSMNPSQEIEETKKEYEKQIANLKASIEKDINDKNAQVINELRATILNHEEEAKILTEKLRLKTDTVEDLKAKIHQQLDFQASNTVTSYSDFEKNNPELFKKIKISVTKLTYGKCRGKIEELEKKVSKLENQLASKKETEGTRSQNNGTSNSSSLPSGRVSEYRVDEADDIDDQNGYDERYEDRDERYGLVRIQGHNSGHSHGHNSTHSHGQVVIASPPLPPPQHISPQHIPQGPPGAQHYPTHPSHHRQHQHQHQHQRQQQLPPPSSPSQRYTYDRGTFYAPPGRGAYQQNSYYPPNNPYRY